MSTIIRTRSPYFIRTPEETDATLGYFVIRITIREGLINAGVPCSIPDVVLILNKKPIGSENSVSFDISEIVNDSLVQTYSSVPVGTYQSLWVDVATNASTLAGAPIGSVTTTTYLAQEGFNKFKEGVNYTVQKSAMLTENYLEYYKGLKIYLPINAEIANTVTWRYNSSNIQTDTITDNGQSNQKIKYISYNPSSQEVDEVVVNTEASGTTIIKLKEIEECKYPVHKITFLNRWGAFQDLFFFKKSTESLNTTSENYNASIFKAKKIVKVLEETGCVTSTIFNSYSTTAHSKKTYNANGVESIVLNSGYVSELNNSYFEELMVSEYVWLTDSNNVIYPVNLKESSFNKKTGLNDGLINYTMSFEKSFSIVNNIR
tara:strand:+ start:61 stop:1185 length:1125 start_codon:yes stop_codon:yes gene_type:complete